MIDRLILEDDPNLRQLRKKTDELDRIVAEAASTSPSPGALGPEARAAAFDAEGEFRGDRGELLATTRAIGRWAGHASSARDREREFWLLMGGCLAAPPVLGLSLILMLRLRRRLRRAPVSRASTSLGT